MEGSLQISLRPPCHQIPSCVPSKPLTKPLVVSMNEHRTKSLAVFPSRQDRHVGALFKVLTLGGLAFPAVLQTLSRPTVLEGGHQLSWYGFPSLTHRFLSARSYSRGPKETSNSDYSAAELCYRKCPNPSDLYLGMPLSDSLGCSQLHLEGPKPETMSTDTLY